MRSKRKSVLLKTSSGNDVVHSGGVLAITGCFPVRVKDLLDIKQIKYKQEVVQVVDFGISTYTPTANTQYKVELNYVNSTREGYLGVTKTYSYTTPAVLTTIGSSAALQREFIHADIIAKINADNARGAVPASAVTKTGGAGIRLTDDAGYYPARLGGASNGRKGPTSVALITNADGTGWVDAVTENVVITAGVVSFGEGQRLLDDKPVLAAYTQNLTSGELDCPKTIGGAFADAGQKYDAFIISSLDRAPAHGITDQLALIPVEQAIFVDNGTGTSTANLSGYKAFRRAMHLAIFRGVYGQDPSSVVEFFDKPILLQGALGAAPATTGTNLLLSEEAWQYTQIGTQTIVGPVIGNTGLLTDQDLTDTEGAEYVPSILTNDPREYVVGVTPFSVYAEVVAADWTDVGFLIGFRKKAAHAADFNNYTDLAGVGSIATVAGGTPNGDLISTNGILNNAATVTTSTGVVPADAVSLTVEVLVDIDGLVTCKVNGVAYPVYSTGTTALILDAGDIMIPTVRVVNIGGGDPDFVISELVSINKDSWKL